MRKICPTVCKICGETRSARGFSFHVSQSHGMKMSEYLVRYEFNGIHPTCACGCGQPVTIRSNQVMEYVNGHSPAGQFRTGESLKRDRAKWLVKTTEGIRRYNRDAKSNDPNYRSGVNNNFFNRKHSEHTKDQIRAKVKEQIKNGKHAFIGNPNGRIGKSKLEIRFEEYLKIVGVAYEHNFKVPYLNDDGYVRYKYYDFYIPIMNMVIEIHGSYWHPRNIDGDLTEMQKGNLRNDLFKKRLSKERYYDILTVYDTELDHFIKENLLQGLLDEYMKHTMDITTSGFVRGRNNVIELPEYWTELVDENSITVSLTAIGRKQELYVKEIKDNKVIIGGARDIDCFYTVFAERKDVEKLVVEF